MYPVHNRTKSSQEIVFRYFFKLESSFIIATFRIFHFEYISFSTGPAMSCYNYMRSPVRLWLIYVNSSVIRQKGESQNGCFKKAKHAKFSEKQTFLTP